MGELPEAVKIEWRRRVVAEYGSAAIIHGLLGWLLRLGASPTLLHEVTRIVADELVQVRVQDLTSSLRLRPAVETR